MVFKVDTVSAYFRFRVSPFFLWLNICIPYFVPRNEMGLTSSCHFSLYMSRFITQANPPESHQCDSFVLASVNPITSPFALRLLTMLKTASGMCISPVTYI